MKITVVDNEFIYGDTDINLIQDEIKAMAQETAKATDTEFDECYKREIKQFEQAVKDYATVLEISMADIEYALTNDYCVEATDIRVGDIKAYQAQGKNEIPANEIALKIKEKLMKSDFDNAEAFASLNEKCSDLHIAVKACYKNGDGEDDYYWVDFYSKF